MPALQQRLDAVPRVVIHGQGRVQAHLLELLLGRSLFAALRVLDTIVVDDRGLERQPSVALRAHKGHIVSGQTAVGASLSAHPNRHIGRHPLLAGTLCPAPRRTHIRTCNAASPMSRTSASSSWRMASSTMRRRCSHCCKTSTMLSSVSTCAARRTFASRNAHQSAGRAAWRVRVAACSHQGRLVELDALQPLREVLDARLDRDEDLHARRGEWLRARTTPTNARGVRCRERGMNGGKPAARDAPS